MVSYVVIINSNAVQIYFALLRISTPRFTDRYSRDNFHALDKDRESIEAWVHYRRSLLVH